MQYAESEVELPPDALIVVPPLGVCWVGPKPGYKCRRPHPIQIERRRANGFENDRRQIPFDHLAHEVQPADLVDFESRHGVVVAIAFDDTAIDVVVAEPPEVKLGNRVVTATGASPYGCSQPYRRVWQRHGKPVVEVAANLGWCFILDPICLDDDIPIDALLVVDGAR